MDKEIIAENKIDNTKVEIEYSDGSKEIKKVKRLNSRKLAIQLCEKETREVLRRVDAYHILHKLRNDFSRYKKYELEDYLYELTGIFYKIDESCPFSGFNWFDND